MPNYSDVQLWIEGTRIDLPDEDIDIALSYVIDDIRDISKVSSGLSKSCTIPGTKANNKAFAFLFDIKSRGSSVPGTTVTSSFFSRTDDIDVDGTNHLVLKHLTSSIGLEPGMILNWSGSRPITTESYSDTLDNYYLYVSGSLPAPGYYSVQAYSISEVDFIPAPNIGTNYDPLKKASCTILVDGMRIMKGYAKLESISIINGQVEYTISITSELSSFISAVGTDSKLEDLATGSFADAFTHQLTIDAITDTWTADPADNGIFYPLIDWGQPTDNNDSNPTVNGTSWRIDNFRPSLWALTYVDLILQNAGYKWTSDFFNSKFFSKIFVPYCDGEMTPNPAGVQITTTLTGSALTFPMTSSAITDLAANGHAIFNYPISGTVIDYTGSLETYTTPLYGAYTLDTSFKFHLIYTPTTSESVFNTEQKIYVHHELYLGAFMYQTASAFYEIPAGQTICTGSTTSQTYTVNFTGASLKANLWDRIITKIVGVPAKNNAQQFTKTAGGAFVQGTTQIAIDAFDGVSYPLLSIGHDNILEHSLITFQQFVPKGIKQIDFINSLVKTFNLFVWEDKCEPKLLHFEPRDSYYDGAATLDWSKKVDYSQEISIIPASALEAKNFLLQAKSEQDDYYNQFYTQTYGEQFGSTVITSEYEWNQDTKDIQSDGGNIFGTGISVQYDQWSENDNINSESTIEIPTSVPYQVWTTGYNDFRIAGYQANAPIQPGFSLPRPGNKIFYSGQEYTIFEVFNKYTFAVDRPLTRSAGNIDGTFVAKNDYFQYLTDSDLVVPTAYSRDNDGKVKPTKTNLRLMFYNGMKDSKSWNIVGTPAYYLYGLFYTQTSQSFNQYPQCSTLYPNNVSASFDLNYGIPETVYFPLAGNYTTNNLYTSFWRNSINQIIDPNSKLVRCWMKLSAFDIANPDLLRSTVFVDGVNYRINRIIDYKPGDPTALTQVELLRIPNDIPVYKPYIDLAYINASVAGSGSITDIQVNDISVSGSGFPLTNGQSATFKTSQIGDSENVKVFINSVSGSAVSLTDTEGNVSSTSFDFTGSVYSLFTDEIIDNGGTAYITLAQKNTGSVPPTGIGFVTSSVTIYSATTIDHVNVSGSPTFYITGSPFPLTHSHHNYYRNLDIGTQQIAVYLTGSAGDIMTISDSTAVTSSFTLIGGTQVITSSKYWPVSGVVSVFVSGSALAPTGSAILTVNYSQGQFLTTLSDIVGNITVQSASVSGYASTASMCTGISSQFSHLTSSIVMNSGVLSGSANGPGITCATHKIKMFSQILVNGSTRNNGDTFAVGADTITLVINTSCQDYDCGGPE